MQQGWNSDSNRDAMLRRVAIVLSSLPASVGNRLLGSMGEESRIAIRRTMTALTDVDPLERQRALHAFRHSMQQQPETNNDLTNSDLTDNDLTESAEAVSRVMSPGSVEVSASGSSTAANVADSDSPLAFLSDVDDDTLVAMIAIEHPQTIALVLASIAPAQAARMLPRLDEWVRQETLSRLGRLGEIPEAAASEVASHFRDRLSDRLGRGSSATGQRALDAILAAMPSDSSTAQPATNAERPPSPGPAVNAAPVPNPTPVAHPAPATEFPSAEQSTENLSAKLRRAVGAEFEATGRSEEAASDLIHSQSRVTESDPMDRAFSDQDTIEPTHVADESVLQSTDSIHQYLIAMKPIELCQSLGRVSTRDAMLTLCGLPNTVSEAALSVLPRSQARKVRSSMNGLGSLQLREIDEAKERVARVALSTTDPVYQSMPMAA